MRSDCFCFISEENDEIPLKIDHDRILWFIKHLMHSNLFPLKQKIYMMKLTFLYNPIQEQII